jgi:DNA replicative helicase MCM subunit Mcm2 (Cdc46/Mcm family)
MVPPEAYRSLKLALLLSLAHGGGDDDLSLSILLVGDCPMASRLLADGCSFATGTNAVHSIATANLTSGCTTDKRVPHGLMVESGTLLRATAGGVVRIPFLEHLKSAELAEMHQYLAAGTVSADLPTKFLRRTEGDGTEPQMTFASQATVWASTAVARGKVGSRSVRGSSASAGIPEGVALRARCSHLPEKLLSRFDLVFVVGEAETAEDDLLISDHILAVAMQNSRGGAASSSRGGRDKGMRGVPDVDQNLNDGHCDGSADYILSATSLDDRRKRRRVSEEYPDYGMDSGDAKVSSTVGPGSEEAASDLTQILEQRAAIGRAGEQEEIKFDEEATQLIQGFYLASRRMRSSSRQTSEISTRSVEVMMQLAKNHAGVSLRKTATVEDALVAIMLYEETLTARHGTSLFHFRGVTTPFRSNIGQYNSGGLVACFEAFGDHVKRFISSSVDSGW